MQSYIKETGYERILSVNIGTFVKNVASLQHELDRTSTILDLLVKGLIVGVVVSAPLGPVGVALYTAHTEQGTMVWICYRSGSCP